MNSASKSLPLLLRPAVLVAAAFALGGPFRNVTAQSHSGSLNTEQAASSQSFVDTIGVNTHVNYFNRLYGNFDLFKAQLQASGIRHVRDNGVVQSDGYNRTLYGRWRQLAAFGVKFDVILDPRRTTGAPTAQSLSQLMGLAGGSIESLEGPNELDDTHKPDWVSTAQSFQQALWAARNAVPSARNLPVIGPSMAFVKNAAQVGDISAYITYGNLHPYPAGRPPSSVFPQQINQARAMYGNKKLVITETGYHNAFNDQKAQPAVSEAAAAKYIPRLYFVDYNWGIVRTYLYEFLDEASDPGQTNHEFHWGLVRNDGTRKPAFDSLRNMIQILQDPGAPASAAGSLAFRLEGDTQNVQHTLLRKQDGRYELALWQEIPSYDTRTQKDIQNPARRVTVVTGQKFRQANLYDPLRGTSAVQHWDASSNIAVNVPDSIVILELVP